MHMSLLSDKIRYRSIPSYYIRISISVFFYILLVFLKFSVFRIIIIIHLLNWVCFKIIALITTLIKVYQKETLVFCIHWPFNNFKDQQKLNNQPIVNKPGVSGGRSGPPKIVMATFLTHVNPWTFVWG